jgi:poly(A) polymerase
MDALGKRGEARFVGGCVRDSLLGSAPARFSGGEGTTDIDIATVLTPEETTAALRAAGLSAHPTGIEHGTVTAVADGLPVEVTTLRADVATDGRHAEVAFTTDWDQDWRRRDFRINALYLGADGTLYDPADGLPDLEACRVRFIGEADERIREDYLRILRFFRFTSRYADGHDADGLAACARGAFGMARLSRERVWQEVAKTIPTPRAPAAFEAMAGAGVLAQVVDSAPDLLAFAALHGLLKASVPEALGVEALWPDAPLPALAAAFKPPKALLARIEAARAAGARVAPEQGAALLRQIHTLGREAVIDASLLAAARTGEARWHDHAGRAAEVRVPSFPLSGKDLVARGVPPGPEVGRRLAAAEAAWLAAGLPEEPEGIEAILASALGER